MMVFSSLVYGYKNDMHHYFAQFAQIFLQGLIDTEAVVRSAAVKGADTLVIEAKNDSEKQMLKQFVQPLMNANVYWLDQDEADMLCYVISVLDGILDARVMSDPEILTLVEYLRDVASKSAVDLQVREKALGFIQHVAKDRPKLLGKNTATLISIVETLINMCLESINDMEESYDEGDSSRSVNIAARSIDELAQLIPSKQIYQITTKLLQPLTTSSTEKKSVAVLILSMIAEGTADTLKKNIESILPFVLQCCESDISQLKGLGATCLGQMCLYLQPEISKYHEKVLECLAVSLQYPSEAVATRVCSALEAMCENLDEDDIRGKLSVFLSELIKILSGTQNTQLQQAALGAICAMGGAAQEEFQPHSRELLNILLNVMNNKDPSCVSLRSRATWSIGTLAPSLKENVYLEYREPLVKAALDGLMNIDNFELRESTYRFFESMCLIAKNDLAPILPTIMTFLMASTDSTDGVEAIFENGAGADPLAADDDEDEDEANVRGYTIRSSFLDEQQAAVECVRVIIENIHYSYTSQYFPRIQQSLKHHSKYFHEGIRRAVPGVYEAMILAMNENHLPSWWSGPVYRTGSSSTTENSSPDTERPWKACMPEQYRLDEKVDGFIRKECWPVLKTMLLEDDDKEVVSFVCRTLGFLVETLGPDMVECFVDPVTGTYSAISKAITEILSSEHPCQKGEESIDECSDSRLLEEYLYEGLTVLIAGLAMATGHQFMNFFQKIYPLIMRLSFHPISSAYRCIGIGCTAEVFSAMGSATSPFVTPELIQVIVSGLQNEEDPELRRNASYCAGVCVQVAAQGEAVKMALPSILQGLYPLLSPAFAEHATDEDLFVIDNATSALARIITSLPQDQLPLQEILPLFLSNIPLQKDQVEQKIIANCLLGLASSPSVSHNLPQFVCACVRVVADTRNMDPSKENLEKRTRDLVSTFGGQNAVRKELEALSKAEPSCATFLSTV
eukprot:GHVP01052400.1.p1 GENE.GHVP01052400.1~~GHVP01052400.1.p1  ORF type:complete len:966 (+),score=175.08 GHVP01052400.1:4377-7274(+)